MVIVDKIRKRDIQNIVGEFCDVDTLQSTLKSMGYQKGELGNQDVWYENLTEHTNGYIAKLQAVSPEGNTVTIIVENEGGTCLIKSVS